MAGLFGTFNIATRGLSAQQKAIDTTSHNIANANTEGYSRQRVTMETSRPFPMPSMNNAAGPGQMGTGVDVTAITRIRDSFLDYQVRAETGVNGQFTGRDKFLSQIENIVNEPTDTGMSKLLGTFFDSWNTLATSAKESNARSMVAQQALSLSNELNHTYAQLESLKDNSQTVIKDTVFDANGILSQLTQLNQQIKQVNVSGNTPNDLMDRRDLLVDQLSAKFGIKIDKRAFDGNDITTSNESKYSDPGDNGNAPLGPDGKTPLNIVQSINPNSTAKFSYVSSIKEVTDASAAPSADGKKNYEVTYYKNGDMTSDENKVVLNVTMTADECKKLDECRVIWSNNNGVALNVTTTNGTQQAKALDDSSNLANSNPPKQIDFSNLALFQAPSGELKGYMSVQQDIDKYEVQLNKFAKGLALSVNAIMSQSSTWKPDNDPNGEGGINNFFVNSKPAGTPYTADDENSITAANITINKAILDDPMKIKAASKYDANGKSLSGESDGGRALAVEMLRDRLMSTQNINSGTTRDGFLGATLKSDPNANNLLTVSNDTGGMTLDSFFKDTVDKLGIQEQEARRMVGNQATLLAGFKESRDSVSGVSLDEEMANLVQFQHCYQANAKIISTVDQLLDVVINGLKK